MAQQEVKVRLSAQDGISGAMSAAANAVRSAGERIRTAAAGVYLLRSAYSALSSVAQRVTTVGKDLVGAYAIQERAERALVGALNAHGEAGAAYLEQARAMASAIQDETGVGDELTIQRMARARMLGVETERLGEAAKAIIALSSAGLEEAAATRAIANAYQGNYTMLNRYLPALRATTDATEQQRILNDFLTAGYAQQQAILSTTTGQWTALQGRIGDAKEALGAVIAENLNASGVLSRLGDTIKGLTARFAVWAGGGGMLAVIYGWRQLRNTIDNVVQIGVARTAELMASAKYYLTAPWTYAVGYVKGFGASVVETAKTAGAWAEYLWDKVRGRDAERPDMSAITDAWDAAVADADRSVSAMADAYAETQETWRATEQSIRDEHRDIASDIASEYNKALSTLSAGTAEVTGDALAATKLMAEATDDVADATAKTETKVGAVRTAVRDTTAEIERLEQAVAEADKTLAETTRASLAEDAKERLKAEREARRTARGHSQAERHIAMLEERERTGRLSAQHRAELTLWRERQRAVNDAALALEGAHHETAWAGEAIPANAATATANVRERLDRLQRIDDNLAVLVGDTRNTYATLTQLLRAR